MVAQEKSNTKSCALKKLPLNQISIGGGSIMVRPRKVKDESLADLTNSCFFCLGTTAARVPPYFFKGSRAQI